jgi:hypothetical protein
MSVAAKGLVILPYVAFSQGSRTTAVAAQWTAALQRLYGRTWRKNRIADARSPARTPPGDAGTQPAASEPQEKDWNAVTTTKQNSSSATRAQLVIAVARISCARAQKRNAGKTESNAAHAHTKHTGQAAQQTSHLSYLQVRSTSPVRRRRRHPDHLACTQPGPPRDTSPCANCKKNRKSGNGNALRSIHSRAH